ncbi:MAG TPA: metallophosphoesterase [Chlamydiales bacterium]|nr:metallophosphoesterase [Chlamydiales bacterium]
MRLVQISDFHFTCLTWNPFRLFSKRILGNFNWLFKRKSLHAKKLLDPLPELFRELKVDLVLLGGDLTTTSLMEEYETALEFVQKLPTQWIAIPGNHDHYTYRSFRKKHFYLYFSNQKGPIAHPVDFFTLKDHGVEAHRMAPGWWILALDTARPTHFASSRGIFSQKAEEYVVEILNLIPPDDSVICFNHYPFFPQDQDHRNLERGDCLENLLKQFPQIRLYLHGHTHRHAIADLQPNHLPILLDSGCCVQGNQGTWNLIDLMSDHCKVTAYKWQSHWNPFRTETFEWKR